MNPCALAIAAHPDDIEFLMAGTLMKLRAAGHEIHYMNVANGCLGTNRHDYQTIVPMRRQEAIEAAGLISATYHESLCNDLEVYYSPGLLARLIAVVREVAPRIILTHGPYEYMEDHINTGRLAVTAAFARGMVNFKSEPPRPAIETPITLYHAVPQNLADQLRRPVVPGIFVNVSECMALKRKMLACHRSQAEWLDVSQFRNSYLDDMENGCRFVGQASGRFEFAEGWVRHSNVGFCAENADPLVESLGRDAVINEDFEKVVRTHG